MTRTARRVLNQRGVIASVSGLETPRRYLSSFAGQVVSGDDRGQRRCLAEQQRGEALDVCERDHQSGVGVAQDADLPLCVFLDTVSAERWIDRDGHSSGEQRTHERREERHLGLEHDGDRLVTA